MTHAAWTIVVVGAVAAAVPRTGRGQEAGGKEETWFLGDSSAEAVASSSGTAEGLDGADMPELTVVAEEADPSAAEEAAPLGALPAELVADDAPEAVVEALLSRCGPPTLAETVDAAVDAAGLDGDEEDALLAEARWAAVLPRIRLTVRRDWEHDESVDLEPDPAEAGYGIDTDDDLELGVTAQWDLGAIVAPGSAPALRRLALEAQAARRALRLEVAGTYSEWCRLRLEWSAAAAEGRRTELAWTLAERSARLDALTGGFFRRASAGAGSAGRQEPWSSARTSDTR